MVAPCLFHRVLVVHDADVWGRRSTAAPARWWWGPKGQEEEEEGGERLRNRTQEKRQRL